MELPDLPGEFVTFAWFVRGRGVATGLRDPSRVVHCNRIVNAMPCYNRGKEYRPMTPFEKELDANARIAAKGKAPSKKRKRAMAAQQQQREDALASAAAAAN